MTERIRRERLRLGLTREEVAACLGIEAEELAAWESGEREPLASQLGNLSRLLGCSPDCLLGLAPIGDAEG